MWNRRGEDRHLCFVPALSGKASDLSPLSMMLTWVFHEYPVSGWESSLLFPACLVLLFFVMLLSPVLGSSSQLDTWGWPPAGLGDLSLYNSLLVLCPMNSGSLSLPRLLTPPLQLRECFTLVPSPCLETRQSAWTITGVTLFFAHFLRIPVLCQLIANVFQVAVAYIYIRHLFLFVCFFKQESKSSPFYSHFGWK